MTRPTYPFPGCCEHSFNAHNRERCLACDCTQPPVQVAAPVPPPTPVGEDLPVEDLRECGVCFALVRNASAERHLKRHEEELEVVDGLTRAVQHAIMLGRPQIRPTQNEETK